MKRALPIVMAMAFAGPVFAQAPAANPNPNTPAVSTQSTPQPGQPAKGSNSFTEDQAKSRIEAKGFTNVTGLAKDNDGIWRGKASKGGTSQDVAVDYQGNVFPN
ncbi:PepSY domain-containing protein [Aquabacter sp. CN5-332]|uniref:PepSY domain-containing protein n=1 Tax=Aquabacter sp. CN5-332 TaxID=3156608 RepID=UPI0032B36531